MNRNTTLLRSFCIAALALPLIAFGQESKQPSKPNRIVIRPDGLPEPFKTPSVQNQPRVIPQPEGAKLELPQGFEISVFSEGDYRNPRWIIEGPNGDLFLTDSAQQVNSIFLLRDSNKDGKIDNATERFTFVTGLNRPFGMAIQKVGAQTYFYVGNTDSVVRF
jgi:glucose/arabinose dehydrogenase